MKDFEPPTGQSSWEQQRMELFPRVLMGVGVVAATTLGGGELGTLVGLNLANFQPDIIPSLLDLAKGISFIVSGGALGEAAGLFGGVALLRAVGVR